MTRAPAKRARLSKPVVIQAAVDLMDSQGIPALTINNLARSLDVKPPSLYNHIAGLDELWRELRLLNVLKLGKCLQVAVVGKSGPQGIMALAQAYRDYIKQYPNLYMASLRASGTMTEPDPELQAAEESVVQVTQTLVASLGLSGADAIHAVRQLRSAIHGFATLEIAGGFGLPLDLEETFHRLIETLIRGMQG